MVLTVFAGIAEFERFLIVERIRRGAQFGRRPALSYPPARSGTPAS
ncbi:MAG TPA: hypothetical protein VIO38_01085 [Rariglobus sp.]